MELLAGAHSSVAITIPSTRRLHEQGYRERAALNPIELDYVRVKGLVLLDDRHFNSGRVVRTQELRRRFHVNPLKKNARYYMSRGKLGVSRGLHNEQEVINFLELQGFVTLVPEDETAHSLLQKLCGADICIGLEGSALLHAAMAMPEGSTIMAIQPPHRFTTVVKIYADAANVKYAFTVGEGKPENFIMPIERLGKILCLVENAG